MLLLIVANWLVLWRSINWYNSALFCLFIKFETINRILIWFHWFFSFTAISLCFPLSHNQMLGLCASKPPFVEWLESGCFGDWTTVGFVRALGPGFMLLSEILCSVAVLTCSFKWELLFFDVFLTLIIMKHIIKEWNNLERINFIR